MRDVSKGSAEHDNPNSAKHKAHKAAKLERDKGEWIRVPALANPASARLVDGIAKAEQNGFCIYLHGGSACRAAKDADYTKALKKMSNERRKYYITRERTDGTRREARYFTHGACSLVSSLSPWQNSIVASLGESRRDELMMFLAEKAADEIKQTTTAPDQPGRETFGAGVHYDSKNGIAHFHFHIPKRPAAEKSNAYPKHLLQSAGQWTTGANIINQKFPDLLTPKKREMLESNLAKREQQYLVDIRVSNRIHSEMEKWIKEEGLQKEYEQACKKYLATKRQAQEEEKNRPLLQQAMHYFGRTGVWPIAAKVMSLAMWRMIPREHRKAITMAIKLYHYKARPSMIAKSMLTEIAAIPAANKAASSRLTKFAQKLDSLV